jgi:hypothetical protein
MSDIYLGGSCRMRGIKGALLAAFGDSVDPAFALAEDAGRFHNACAMEVIAT